MCTQVRGAHISDERRSELESLPAALVSVTPVQDWKMLPPLQESMALMIRVFHSYSGKEGDKYKLNKGELKMLLNEELSDFIAASNDPAKVEKIMNDLDGNQDGEVDFPEFVFMVALLTVACNEFFEEKKE
ncbi:S100-A1-like [Solea senegalensis]|uniref:Protein S100 n=1 Tax=Solea senegalensis TaxID=28829 RepID=A0AAV6PT64_SOLSE|nr:S100-A1-like [Solea senegalensis]